MKKILFSILFLSLCWIGANAQTKVFEQNPVSGDIIYYNKDRGTGGRAFVHDTNNRLTINFGNDFAGGIKLGTHVHVRPPGTTPYEFYVEGNLLAQTLTLSRGILLSDLILQSDGNEVLYNTWGRRLYFGTPRESTDDMFIARYNTGFNASELRVCIGDDNLENAPYDLCEKFRIGIIRGNDFAGVFTVTGTGSVGIGVDNPQNALDVNGTVHAKEVKIDNNGWADFVFETGYKLPTLAEVEAHIQEHKRLPEIPSEAEVKEKGVDVGEMQVKLLQKIEELTLYTIQLEKRIKELENNK
ncbi:hypothetical protein [Dysgonomonas sp. 25]|uniref:hypothetical protein n=1 Tax=Dysgonomonas sp. 25 TaxID=2302933 RepID=UPI0013D15546|nr:hypothetical protein [Dysgonomonas sp. 25]NDV69240.1 hypothetical protein [Dysgonomonas sp. 25]